MIVFLLLFLIQPPATATVSGRVELGEARIQQSGARSQSRYARNRPAEATREQVPVLVWIEGAESVTHTNTEPPVLNQKDTKFEPRLVVVVAGRTVRVINSDPIYHNVFSLSDAKRFNVGRRPAGEYVDVRFDTPGEVQVFCDIHSSMNATIRVLPNTTHQWVVLDGADGFRLPPVPAGRYTIHVYAPGYGEVRKSVNLTAGQRLELETFVLEP